jgi:Zn-dependent peptidase ImmA (M78 family)/predicted secreted protein
VAKSWREVRLIAARAAERAFLALGIDSTRRVDPFAALEADGVLVMRQPLDRLAGMYLPTGVAGDGRPGVLVNAQHPLSKQRFTAAHELAHHRLHHQVVLDEETEVGFPVFSGSSEQEQVAEAFAAWFLMPRRLVLSIAARLGLAADRLDAEGAYALGLELGTSYAATVRHLADMRIISFVQRDELLRVQPRDIKRRLGALDAMEDAWRDVWRVRHPPADLEIRANEGDVVWVEVPEAPSSGYIWQAADIPDGLSLVREEYQGPNGTHGLGGRGYHRFLLRMEAPGRRRVRLVLRRPWLADREPPAEERWVQISTAARPMKGLVQPEILLAVA